MSSEKKIMLQDEYEMRIIAFADILGWREAIKEFKKLRETVTLIENYAKNFSHKIKKDIEKAPEISSAFKAQYFGIEFSFFSDSFAISAPVAYGENVFKIIAVASDMLLRKQFLVRGGVTIGELYHCQRCIFGPALVEAVNLEGKDALYPRFICSDTLVKHLDSTDYKHKVVLQDFPQSWVVNIKSGSFIARDELMTIIETELSKEKMSERNRRKWRYLQEMMPKMY